WLVRRPSRCKSVAGGQESIADLLQRLVSTKRCAITRCRPGLLARGLIQRRSRDDSCMPPDVDLLAPAVVANPHPAFACLREEDPVHWSERHRAWVLTRYDDVTALFRDLRLSSDRASP